MGIRNFGLCVLEAPSLTEPAATSHALKLPTKLKIIAWKKVDVLGQLSPKGPNATPAKRGRAPIDASVFTPSLLSKTARSITQDLLATYNPSHILVERQRFRSGGASAVQEWTLRVNMLESMIWASLETLRSVQKSNVFPQAHEVSPARVANFWCPDAIEERTAIDDTLFANPLRAVTAPKERKKIEKKDKIAVVRSWLAAIKAPKSTAIDVQLELSPDVLAIANDFDNTTTDGRRRSKDENGSSGSKLDDLADCLLQGAAWVRWEENRQRLYRLLSNSTDT